MSKQMKTARTALIGAALEVVRAKNPTLVGMRGKAVDETKNTIIIETDDGQRTLIKDQVVIKVDDRTIEGEKLAGRIEARVKQ